MQSPIFGEFMGTFVLILLGDGVVAGVLLKLRQRAAAGLSLQPDGHLR